MTTTNVTIETAERNHDALVKYGRFILRNLADALPVWGNNDEKQSFLKLGTDDQAKAVHAGLLEWDKKNKGGGGTKAATGAKRDPVANGKSAAKAPAASTREPAASGNEQTGGSGNGNLSQLLELLGEIKQNQEALATKQEELESAIAAVHEDVAGGVKISSVAISLALQMSETVLNAPAAGVLEAAISQLADIEPMLQDIIRSASAADEDENDAGNE